MYAVLELIKKLYRPRTCRFPITEESVNQKKHQVCLEYHIKRCLAPCVGLADPEEYHDMVRSVCLFLEGRTDEVEKALETRMATAAENLQFELAARLRDQLKAVRRVAEKQNIVTGYGDQDAVGMARSGLGVCVQMPPTSFQRNPFGGKSLQTIPIGV